MNFEELFNIILDRKKRMPEDSYVASLFREGEDRIVQKVGEEAVEVLLAAKDRDKKRITSEVTDLWFHTLILLACLEISPEEIYRELGKRRKKKKQT